MKIVRILWEWRPMKFFIVNGLGGILALGLFYLMVDYWNYSGTVSALASQIFCQLFNFFPQKYVVFKEKDFRWSEIKREFWEYLFAGFVIIGLNTYLMKIVDYYYPSYPTLNQIAVSFILNVPSYIMNEKIFKKIKPA